MSSRADRRRDKLVAADHGFNFTDRIRDLCADISRRMPELHHVDVTRVIFAFAQTRKPVMHGMQASLTPLRFEGGRRWGSHRGRRVTVQPVFDPQGREVLYILTIYLPRYMDLEFSEKLTTLFHELWHIHPAFNGDLRRHAGRCYAHSRSQANYDAEMTKLADRWLREQPPESLYDFLRHDFRGLQQRCGPIVGMRTRRPRLLPCAEA